MVALKGGVKSAGSARVAVVPFDSANKFMATLNEGADGSRAILVKGAADRLLERSTSQRGVSGPERLDIGLWETVIDDLGRDGLRVLAAPAGRWRRSSATCRWTTSTASSSWVCGASSTRRGPRPSRRSPTVTPPASASR
nr:hypothetical protein GCM10025699_33920 [Microbacterium flavescens]